jgi:hypothetical protein
MKTVFFASGSAGQAIRRLAELPAGDSEVRVVAPAALAGELRASTGREVRVFRPAAVFSHWRDLRRFLSGQAGTVTCLSCGPHYRLLKLFAYTVRWNVTFLRPDGPPVTLGLATFLWLTIARLWAREKGVLIVATAGNALLGQIVEDVRRRRPEADVVILRGGAGDYLTRVRQWRRFRYIVIPWTAEGHSLLKLAAWFLPCGRREIYNERADCFSVRQTGVLLAHTLRRTRELAEVFYWKMAGACRRTRELAEIAWWRVLGFRRRTREIAEIAWWKARALPRGVTVLGSASGYYLRDIVADVRDKHPGERVHGLLPPRLVAPAAALFDSITVLRPASWRTWAELAARAFGPQRTGWYVIPFTNEGLYTLKIAGMFLPLGRREIYNENHDGFLLRSPRMLFRHLYWRIYHRLFYQALTERGGRSWLVHLGHLLAYPVRLLRGAALLFAVRVRSLWLAPAAAPKARPAKIPALAAGAGPEEVFDAAER